MGYGEVRFGKDFTSDPCGYGEVGRGFVMYGEIRFGRVW